MVVGVADITGTPAIAKVTFTVTGVPPFGEIVKVAVYAVDDACNPLGFAVTTKLNGVITEELPALVVSQLAELVTVKEIADVPEVAFAIATVWVAGLAPPCV